MFIPFLICQAVVFFHSHYIYYFTRHSKELIQRLEQAGLGYHVDAEKTTDKLGNNFKDYQLYKDGGYIY